MIHIHWTFLIPVFLAGYLCATTIVSHLWRKYGDKLR